MKTSRIFKKKRLKKNKVERKQQRTVMGVLGLHNLSFPQFFKGLKNESR